MNLNKINNELKSYINETSFISMKCRNKLLKIFSEEFNIKLDISNYQNVDLKINDDFTITYREDKYTSEDNITTFKELEEKYNNFKLKADTLIKRREIDFQGKSNFNNIVNLIVLLLIFITMGIVLYLGVIAFIAGHYFDCLWFVVFIVPMIIPKLKYSLRDRLIQARDYIKRLIKRVK